MKNNQFTKLLSFLLFILLLLPFFPIPYLEITFPVLSNICNYYRILSFLFIVFLMINKKSISYFNLSLFLFCIVLLISTIINNADIKQCISSITTILGLCFVIEYGVKNDTKIFLNSFEFVLYSFVVINFITIILVPEGLYFSHSISFTTKLNWFLGFKNNHIVFIVPALAASIINSYYTYNKLTFRNYFLLIISAISMLIVNSSTSLIGIATIILLLLYLQINKKTKIINIYNFIGCYVSLFFGFVIFRLQEVFKYFIVNVLGKNVTFTGRIYIWDYVMDFIRAKPLLGYGVENANIRYLKTVGVQSYHAHNEILEMIYKSGFIGLLITIYIYYIAIKELYKFKNNKISKIFSIFIFAYSIMMLTEAYSFENIFIFLTIGYNIKYFIKGEKYENK